MTFGDRLTFSCSFMHETTIAPIRQRDSQIDWASTIKILGTHYVDNDPINLDATLKGAFRHRAAQDTQMLALRDMYVAEIAEAIDKGMSTRRTIWICSTSRGLSPAAPSKRTYYMLDRANFQSSSAAQRFMGMKR